MSTTTPKARTDSGFSGSPAGREWRTERKSNCGVAGVSVPVVAATILFAALVVSTPEPSRAVAFVVGIFSLRPARVLLTALLSAVLRLLARSSGPALLARLGGSASALRSALRLTALRVTTLRLTASVSVALRSLALVALLRGSGRSGLHLLGRGLLSHLTRRFESFGVRPLFGRLLVGLLRRRLLARLRRLLVRLLWRRPLLRRCGGVILSGLSAFGL